jgi:hypothetical protein
MAHGCQNLQGRLGSIFASGGKSMLGQSSYVQLLKMLKAFRLARLMKLLRIAKLSSLLARYQDHFFLFAPILSIVKLVAVLLYCGHLSGCFFFFFSSPSFQTEVEQDMIAARDMMTWTQTEMFSWELYVTPMSKAMADTAGLAWQPAQLQDGSYLSSESGDLHCPDWYYIHWQEGAWICVSTRGFLPRYIASLYWVCPAC